MITQVHHLNSCDSSQVPNTTYQVSRPSVNWFWRSWIYYGFYHKWAWRPCWTCAVGHLNRVSFPGGGNIKFGYHCASDMRAVIWCFFSSKYKSSRSKAKVWPWDLVFTNLHAHIWTTVYTRTFFGKVFQPIHEILCSGIFRIWLCRWKDQSQAKVIIWTILKDLEHHIYQVSRPLVSWFQWKRF